MPAVARLTASPNFSLCQAANGSAYVVGEVEPYPQYWLCERERLLFALFGRKGGVPVEEAMKALLALRPAADPLGEQKRIDRAIAGMVAAGVLIAPAGELSRYGKAMARDYLVHRPFPTGLVGHLRRAGGIGGQSRVLDLASGPGSLALALAEHTPHVSVMELSRGFVAAARAEAKRRGLALGAINESCNRLVQLDASFDVITVSQALHWLDDVAVCKGVCRTLAAAGSFFVIHAAMDLPESHPLAHILGNRTPLGDKLAVPFAEQVRPLFRRLALLFGALDAPDVERHDPAHARAGSTPIAGAGISLFRQERPMGEGFARAFLSDRHIAVLGQTADAVQRDIAERCSVATPDQLMGAMDWAVLHFRRGAADFDWAAWSPPEPEAIAYP
ncbi:class I SAM-dependent methyltransferase [Novosphingobium piscinae]|nr:class I SAM-dependent methyltransferase [Novosphingobium piscinae]